MIAQRALIELAKALEGMPVLGCVPGEKAAQAGIRYGDVLLCVNGQRTRTFAEYVAAKQLRRDGMSVVLFRDGREQAVELCFEQVRDERENARSLVELAANTVRREALAERDPSWSN